MICEECGLYTRRAQPCIRCKKAKQAYFKKWKKKQDELKLRRMAERRIKDKR